MRQCARTRTEFIEDNIIFVCVHSLYMIIISQVHNIDDTVDTDYDDNLPPMIEGLTTQEFTRSHLLVNALTRAGPKMLCISLVIVDACSVKYLVPESSWGL